MTTASFFDQSLDEPHPFEDAAQNQPTLDGRYRLVEKIGEGAMGMVFRACQLSTGQDVAVKLIKNQGAGGNALLQRFQREAAIIAELRHPHIVRLLDIGKDEEFDLSYIVMEYVQGTTLGHYLHDQPEPMRAQVTLALQIVMQVCNALTEPHSKGIIHRDIKPDNILLGVRSDELLDVKLLDFGVAHVSPHQSTEVQSHRLTSTGCIVGTPHYLAPELCHTSQSASVASDLYAVGVLLFELLAGYSPFNGESVVDILFRHAHQDAPRISFGHEVDVELADDLNDLIGELLDKDPLQRPSSALEVSQHILALIVTHGLITPMLDHTAPVKSLGSCFVPGTASVHTGEEKELKETQLGLAPRMAYTETLEEEEEVLAQHLEKAEEPAVDDADVHTSEEAYGELAASLHALEPVLGEDREKTPLRTRSNGARTMEFLNYKGDQDDMIMTGSFLDSMSHRMPMVVSAAAFVVFMIMGGVLLSTGSVKEAESAPTPHATTQAATMVTIPDVLVQDTSAHGITSLVSAVPEERPDTREDDNAADRAQQPTIVTSPNKRSARRPDATVSEKTRTMTAPPKARRDHVQWLYSK